MPRPFVKLDSVDTDEGLLELRRRGERDFMILVDGRVLMTSTLTSSELALAERACERIAHLPRPRLLIGGLGLGFTLRAALDGVPPRSHVVVAELNARVVDWCKGPLASENRGAALDRRVEILVGDVTDEIARVAGDDRLPRYDAVVWDLYVGPQRTSPKEGPLYGDESVERTALALSEGGVFAVWGESRSPAFERRLRAHGFSTEVVRTGGKGLRHSVFLSTKTAPRRKPKRGRGAR